MIIGIDGNEANVDKKVGVSMYTYHLLHEFRKKANKKTQFIIYLRTQPNAELPAETEFFKYEVVPGTILWSKIFLPLHLYTQNKIDVFFSPAHYIPQFCPVPVMVTIHDLSFFYYPDDFLKKDLYKLTQWTEHAVNQAKKIIAVSKTTKKDISKYYDISQEKVSVIYNGFQQSKISTNKNKSVLTNYQLQATKYVLYVGTLQPRKNILFLIEAFEKWGGKDFKLVITGKKGWLYDEIFNKVKNKKLEDRIIFTGYESDENVAELYKYAFCFVHPSLYEGFGIPILEAMAYECPVICSHSSSLPEIGGDACLYFNPTDKDDLVDKLQMLLGNDKLRKELTAEGNKRVKLFSWEKCAEETLKLIQSAT